MKHLENRNLKYIAITTLLFLFVQFCPSHIIYAHQKDIQSISLKNRYIVELKGNPLANMRNTMSSEGLSHMQSIVKLQHSLFLESCFKSTEGQFFFEYEYSHLFNGFSIYSTNEELLKIQDSPFVRTVYLAQEYYLQRETSVPYTKAPFFWEQENLNGLHYRGQGVLIGIIDTGVDYRHGELGGGIGKTWDKEWYKVKTGYDFSTMNSIPYTIGISNHGTHVAGIVAGNGENGIAVGHNKASGVAPEASLAIYKVFANQSSTNEAALLMALEQSLLDGCDVVNLSLGKNFGWTNDPLSIACDRLSEAGVIVVASAGNSGARNTTLNPFPIHAPGSGVHSISVAASDATSKEGFYFYLDRDPVHFAIGKLVEPSPKATQQAVPIEIITGLLSKETFEKKELEGKAVMVFLSEIKIATLYQYAENSAIHSLLCVHSKDVPAYFRLPTDHNKIPVMSLSLTTGTYIQSCIESQTEPLLIRYGYQEEAVTIAPFSSQGPTPDFFVKPEITAPGYKISSTLTKHQYGTLSGTSMSSPHVAGGAALLKQLHPDWSPNEIKSLLINYATPLFNPLTRDTYSIYLQGGGTMNLRNSFSASLVVQPPTLSFGCIEENKSQWIQITNKGEETVTTEIICSSPTHQNAAVIVSPYRFTLAPNETIPIKITLEITDHTIQGYGEFWLVAIGKNGQHFQIPSIFHHGSYPRMDTILTSYMFPTLAVSPNYDGYGDETNYVCLSPYNIDGIEVDLYDQEDQWIQNLFYHRSSLGAGYYSIPFVGMQNGKPLEEGLYTIKSYVLPTGKDYKKVNNWQFGKESKTLIDVTSPDLKLEHLWIEDDTIHIYGQIEDANSSYGLFLYYELDYDDGSMLSVDHDGSFDHVIKINDEHSFIRFTAQDIAGNRSSVKKRIPYSEF